MGKKCRKKIHWRKLSLNELPTEKCHIEDLRNNDTVAFPQLPQDQSFRSAVKSSSFSRNERNFDKPYRKYSTSDRSSFPKFDKNMYNDHLSTYYEGKRRPPKMFDRVEFRMQSPLLYGDEPIKRRWSERGRGFVEEGKPDDQLQLREENEKLSQPVHTVLIDNEEYTKIHTPRQEVIFKKSSLDRKRESIDLESSASASESVNECDLNTLSDKGSVTESLGDTFPIPSEDRNQPTWEGNRISYDDANNMFLADPGKPPLAGVVMQQAHPGGPMISIPVHWTPYLEPGLIPGETALTPLDPTFTHIIDPEELPYESTHILPIQRDSSGCPVTVQVKVDSNGLPIEIEPAAFTVSLSSLDASQRDTILHKSPDLFHMAAQVKSKKENAFHHKNTTRENPLNFNCLAYDEKKCDAEVETSIVSNECYRNISNEERKDSEESSPDSQYSSMSETSTAPTTPSEELCDHSDPSITSNSKQRNEPLQSALLYESSPSIDSTEDDSTIEESPDDFSLEKMYYAQPALTQSTSHFSNEDNIYGKENLENKAVDEASTENQIKSLPNNSGTFLDLKEKNINNITARQSIGSIESDSGVTEVSEIAEESNRSNLRQLNELYNVQEKENTELIKDSNHSMTNENVNAPSFKSMEPNNAESKPRDVSQSPERKNESTQEGTTDTLLENGEPTIKENKDNYTYKSGFVMVPILTPYYDPAVLYGYPVVIPGNANERFERNFCRKKKKKFKKRLQEDMFLEPDLYTGKPLVATPNGYMVPVEAPEMCHVHGLQYLPSMHHPLLSDEVFSSPKRSLHHYETSREINCTDTILNKKENHNSSSVKFEGKEQNLAEEVSTEHSSISEDSTPNSTESCELNVLYSDNLDHQNCAETTKLKEKQGKKDVEQIPHVKESIPSNSPEKEVITRKNSKNENSKTKKVRKKKGGKQKQIKNTNETMEILEPDFTSFSNGSFRFESKKEKDTLKCENKKSTKRHTQNSVSEEVQCSKENSCNKSLNTEKGNEAKKNARLLDCIETPHLQGQSKEKINTNISPKSNERRQRSKNLKRDVMEENNDLKNKELENHGPLAANDSFSETTTLASANNENQQKCSERAFSPLDSKQGSVTVPENETVQKTAQLETQISSSPVVSILVVPSKLTSPLVPPTSLPSSKAPILPSAVPVVLPVPVPVVVSTSTSDVVPRVSSPETLPLPLNEKADHILVKPEVPSSKDKVAYLRPKENTSQVYSGIFRELGVTEAVKNWISEITPERALFITDDDSSTETDDESDDTDDSSDSDDDWGDKDDVIINESDDTASHFVAVLDKRVMDSSATMKCCRRVAPFTFAYSDMTAVKLLYNSQSFTSAEEYIRRHNYSLLSLPPDSKPCINDSVQGDKCYAQRSQPSNCSTKYRETLIPKLPSPENLDDKCDERDDSRIKLEISSADVVALDNNKDISRGMVPFAQGDPTTEHTTEIPVVNNSSGSEPKSSLNTASTSTTFQRLKVVSPSQNENKQTEENYQVFNSSKDSTYCSVM